MMKQKPLFITFEGIDGCGKTTQLNNVYELLTESGIEVVKTHEPGALEVGSQIRNIVLHYKGDVSDICEIFLFLADRAQHADTYIRPMLKENKVVLCDRYIDSTVAYQGYGRERDVDKLTELNRLATTGLLPDLTFVFDVEVETGRTRVGKNQDRLEAAGREFFTRTREGYLKLAKTYPERIRVINGENSKETVYNEVKSHIIDIMNG